MTLLSQAPYDTLYRRSFDAVPNDARSTRSGNDSRPERHHHHRDSYYDDDAAFYYEKQRQVGRPRDEYEDPYGARVDGGYHDNGGRSQRSRRSHRHRDEDDESEAKKRLSGLCGKETKDVAATVVGALGGAFVGHEASHGKGFGTLGGAVLGGLSANAIEHSHLK